jgi:hypothetical protein
MKGSRERQDLSISSVRCGMSPSEFFSSQSQRTCILAIGYDVETALNVVSFPLSSSCLRTMRSSILQDLSCCSSVHVFI